LDGEACVAHPFDHVPTPSAEFMKLIMPFIDPKTREKLSFEDSLVGEVPLAHMEKAFGGTADFSSYDHQSYWFDDQTSITSIAMARKQKMLENFRQAGGAIGISEKVIKEGL
jgi:hypothetical protein